LTGFGGAKGIQHVSGVGASSGSNNSRVEWLLAGAGTAETGSADFL